MRSRALVIPTLLAALLSAPTAARELTQQQVSEYVRIVGRVRDKSGAGGL